VASLSPYLHSTHLWHITAPTRPPELILTALVNSCIYNSRTAALPGAWLKISIFCLFLMDTASKLHRHCMWNID